MVRLVRWSVSSERIGGVVKERSCWWGGLRREGFSGSVQILVVWMEAC